MNFWQAVTFLGEPELWLSLIIFTAILAFLKKDKSILFISISVLLTLVATYLLKLGLRIDRPCKGMPSCPSSYSFPSGHASATSSFSTSLNVVKRRALYMLAFILPVIVSASRLALGVHTLSDVVAGFLLGVVLPALLFRLWERVNLFKRHPTK